MREGEVLFYTLNFQTDKRFIHKVVIRVVMCVAVSVESCMIYLCLEKRVCIIFESRKFFCKIITCQHRTFAEQPGDEIFRYRRRTRRCLLAVMIQGLCVSSNSIEIPDYKELTTIGINDWAYRKGKSYSRKEQFLAEEKALLRALPAHAFEIRLYRTEGCPEQLYLSGQG